MWSRCQQPIENKTRKACRKAPEVLMKKEPMAPSNCRLDEMEKVFVGQDGLPFRAVITQKIPVSTNSS